MKNHNPPPEPLINLEELTKRSLYKAVIAEFVVTVLYAFIGIRTIIGIKNQIDPALTSRPCHGLDVDLLRIIWGSGTMISILSYGNAGISGKHINPAVTLGLFLSRKVSLIRAVMYVIVQCLGSICGIRLAREFQNYSDKYGDSGGGGGEANFLVSSGYTKGVALGVEIIGTCVLFYTVVFSDIDPKRTVGDSHHHVLLPPTPSMAPATRATVITCIKLINNAAKLCLLPSSN